MTFTRRIMIALLLALICALSLVNWTHATGWYVKGGVYRLTTGAEAVLDDEERAGTLTFDTPEAKGRLATELAFSGMRATGEARVQDHVPWLLMLIASAAGLVLVLLPARLQRRTKGQKGAGLSRSLFD